MALVWRCGKRLTEAAKPSASELDELVVELKCTRQAINLRKKTEHEEGHTSIVRSLQNHIVLVYVN